MLKRTGAPRNFIREMDFLQRQKKKRVNVEKRDAEGPFARSAVVSDRKWINLWENLSREFRRVSLIRRDDRFGASSEENSFDSTAVWRRAAKGRRSACPTSKRSRRVIRFDDFPERSVPFASTSTAGRKHNRRPTNRSNRIMFDRPAVIPVDNERSTKSKREDVLSLQLFAGAMWHGGVSRLSVRSPSLDRWHV